MIYPGRESSVPEMANSIRSRRLICSFISQYRSKAFFVIVEGAKTSIRSRVAQRLPRLSASRIFAKFLTFFYASFRCSSAFCTITRMLESESPNPRAISACGTPSRLIRTISSLRFLMGLTMARGRPDSVINGNPKLRRSNRPSFPLEADPRGLEPALPARGSCGS